MHRLAEGEKKSSSTNTSDILFRAASSCQSPDRDSCSKIIKLNKKSPVAMCWPKKLIESPAYFECLKYFKLNK
jgi:hypothetical protein